MPQNVNINEFPCVEFLVISISIKTQNMALKLLEDRERAFGMISVRLQCISYYF